MTQTRFHIIAFLFCLLVSTFLVGHLLIGFLTPVVMALIIVSIFGSAHRKLLKSLNNRESLAALLSTTMVCLGVLIPLVGFSVLLVQQALVLFQATDKLTSTSDVANWMKSLRELLENLNQYLASFGLSISPDRILKIASSIYQTVGGWIYGAVGFLATNLFFLVINFILTVAMVFVFFRKGKEIKAYFMDIVPLKAREKEELMTKFRELASAVFVGNGLISIIEGLLGSLSFFVFGIPGALIWGVLIAITAFLPLVGCSIIVIPAAIYLFVVGNVWQGMVFLVFNTLQIGILESIVKPKFIGTKSQMHAVLVFMAVFAGVQIYGPLGIFYGPLVVTIFLALAEIYRNHYRDKLIDNEK